MKTLKRISAFMICMAFLLMMTGCGSNPAKHTGKFSKIKGEWELDSIYINSRAYSHATATEKTHLTIEDGKMTKVITSKKHGNSTKDYTITASDGKIEVAGGVTYTFNYDPGAEVLHMYYTNAKGREVHEMYKKYVEEEKTEKTDDSKTENQNTDKTQQ